MSHIHRAVLFCLIIVYLVQATPSLSENKLVDLNVVPKIINGTIAELEKTKHQVSIRLKSADWIPEPKHICGGSLIKPSVVLTAAHCVYNYNTYVIRNASEFRVSMGSLNLYDMTNNTVFDVLRIHYKETFNPILFIDDIAIMVLKGSIREAHATAKVIPMKIEPVADGTVCEVTGWGFITEQGPISAVLMSLEMPIVNHSLCAISFPGILREGMICAGYMEGMRDACNGDSGGPLVCNGNLTGIVSFGKGCARPDYPGVYTEVRYHSDWIRNVTAGVGLLTSSSILLFMSISIIL